MAIKLLLIGAFETALNAYIRLDQDSGFFLAPLAGKVIAVTVEPFAVTLYLCPTADSIQVLDQFPGRPDTQITGSAWSLGLMGLSARPMRSVFSGEVKIEGDIHTGRKFQQLFDKLDIDLEEMLSHFTGDIIAHRVGRFFRAGKNWSKESAETLRLNISEFLQEETRDLPAGPEMDIYYHQVDDIRTGFDRLNSRIERFEAILGEKLKAQGK